MKKIELSKVQDENRYLTTTFEQAQQRLADLNRNYADSMALLNEKIHRLSAAKKKAEQDKVHYQSDIARTEEALSKIKDEKERENQESNSKLGDLDKEYHQIVRENEEADQKISGAQQEVVRAKAQLAALREEHKRLAEQNGVTSKDLADVEAEHKELLSVNRSLLTKVAEAKDQLAATDRQKSDVQLQIEDMSAEIKKITRNHADLKQFVSSRFFPAGQVPSALNDPPPPAQRAREHTNGRFPQPKQTLKTQQIHKKMKEQKAARMATVSGSATARSSSQQHTSPRATSTATPSKKYSDPFRNTSSHAPMTQRRVRSPVSRTRSPLTK